MPAKTRQKRVTRKPWWRRCLEAVPGISPRQVRAVRKAVESLFANTAPWPGRALYHTMIGLCDACLFYRDGRSCPCQVEMRAFAIEVTEEQPGLFLLVDHTGRSSWIRLSPELRTQMTWKKVCTIQEVAADEPPAPTARRDRDPSLAGAPALRLSRGRAR